MINQIIEGDCLDVMKSIPNNSIDLVVTSPPYDDLRDYEGYSFDFESIAKELFRLMKKGGVVTWIVGDAMVDGSETGTSFRQALYFKEIGLNLHDTMIYEKNGSSYPAGRDGNRYTQIFEYMFVFSKGGPKSTKLICDKKNRWEGYTSFGKSKIRDKYGELKTRIMTPVPAFSPRNNIWRYYTGKNYSSKDTIASEHPAIFPEKLARDHILSWSNENDIVLDPMCGSGTTCKMAKQLNRRFIGIEISKEYCDIANNRLEQRCMHEW